MTKNRWPCVWTSIDIETAIEDIMIFPRNENGICSCAFIHIIFLILEVGTLLPNLVRSKVFFYMLDC